MKLLLTIIYFQAFTTVYAIDICTKLFHKESAITVLQSNINQSNPELRIRELRKQGDQKAVNHLVTTLQSELASGEISLIEPIANGSTKPYFIKFASGLEAIWKPQNISESPEREMAAIAVDQFIGTYFIPTTIIRKIRGVPGILQVKVLNLDAQEKEDYPDQFFMFDYLITNNDRHSANYVSSDSQPFAIDHGRAFHSMNYFGQFTRRIDELISMYNENNKNKYYAIQKLKQITVSKQVFYKVKVTSKEKWGMILNSYLSKADFDHFLKRRNEIVRAINKAHSVFGEEIYADGVYCPLMNCVLGSFYSESEF